MAEYIHATLYQFHADAFNDIIASFNATIQDTSAKCWYNADTQCFCLQCPQGIGSQADGVLGDILDKYITDELANAEDESRPPKARRFPESCIDDAEADDDLQTGPTSSSGILRQQSGSALPILHFVHLEQSLDSSLKLFKMGQLPDGIVERTLPSSDAGATKAVHLGLTCRAVRWSAEHSEYIFNGRFGAPVNSVDKAMGDIMNVAAFLQLQDQRSNTIMPEVETEEVHAAHWRFRNGEDPGIQRFLEGMGEIEPDEPDIKPEIPADAAKFMNRTTLPGAAQGRIRVPRPTVESSDSSDEDDSDSSDGEASDEAFDTGLDNILMARIGANTINNKQNVPAIASASTDKTATPTIASLLSGTVCQASNIAQYSNTARLDSENAPSFVASGNGEAMEHTPTTHSIKDKKDNSTSQFEEIPTYNRKYATVDHIGLTSIAANQAAWEHENPSTRKRTGNRSGISRRQQSESSYAMSPIPTSGSSAAMSLSNGPELLRRPCSPTITSTSVSMNGPSTIRTNTEPSDGEEVWRNKLVCRTAPTGKLVDDSSPPTKAPVKLPPGLEPPPSFGSRNGSSPAVPQNRMGQTSSSNQAIERNMAQTLIDISDHEYENTRPTVKLPSTSFKRPLQPSNKSNNAALYEAANLQDDSDQIIERLQPDTYEPVIKRNTMRQKKGKGQGSTLRKKKKPTGQRPKVELPKPDPVPPPRPKQASNPVRTGVPAHASSSKAATVPRGGSSSESDSGMAHNPSRNVAEGNSKPMVATEKLLMDVAAITNIHGAEIVAKFGMILVRHPDWKDSPKGAFTKNAVEDKLRKAGDALESTFFPRMTTSVDDAQYLLELIPGTEVNVEIGYDIQVRVSDGSLRTIKFDQTAVEDFVVVFANDSLGTLYSHYPLRVWDAQVNISRPEIDDATMATAASFVFSMQSTEEAPSFFAMVPPASFAIERVYAKRNFIKKVMDNIELEVTEIRDLMLESVKSTNYNFKAVTLPAEAMMEAQRLWWECSLHSMTVDHASAVTFQIAIDDLVSKVDGVGYGNKGPWEKSQIDAAPSGEGEWFW